MEYAGLNRFLNCRSSKCLVSVLGQMYAVNLKKQLEFSVFPKSLLFSK